MGFGHKGVDRSDDPANAVPHSPSPSPQFARTYDDHEGTGVRGRKRRGIDFRSRRGWIVVAVILVPAITLLDVLLAGTSLITPINPALLWTVVGTCAATGFGLGLWEWLMSENPERGVRATFGVFLGFPLLAGAWGYVTTWRMAEHVEFFSVETGWEPAVYPITRVNFPSRRRPFSRATISIDPYGAGDTNLPIPDSQRDQLYMKHEGLCVTVQQRRSPGGAVQIRTSGGVTWSEPPPQPIQPC